MEPFKAVYLRIFVYFSLFFVRSTVNRLMFPIQICAISRDVIVLNFFPVRCIDILFLISIILMRCIYISKNTLHMP